jgi:hypothetical protein
VGSEIQTVGGLLLGTAATTMLSSQISSAMPMLPNWGSSLLVGLGLRYIGKNKPLFKAMSHGAFVVLGLQLLAQFFPSFKSGLSLGIIAPSNFYVPQVPLNGSMTRFVTPAGVTAAIPAMPVAGSLRGLESGQGSKLSMRRTGRVN